MLKHILISQIDETFPRSNAENMKDKEFEYFVEDNDIASTAKNTHGLTT